MRRGYVFLGAGIALAALSAPSQAQAPCDQRAKIVSILLQQYDETQVGSGLTPTAKCWSCLRRPPEAVGRSC